MNVTVRLPPFVCGAQTARDEIRVAARSVREMVEALERECPGLRGALCDDRGELRRFVAVFVNGEDVRTLQGLDTPLPPEARVDVVTAFAGG